MNINSFHNIAWGGKSVPYGPSEKGISFIFLSRIYDLQLWFGIMHGNYNNLKTCPKWLTTTNPK
jgi:hypothetical protein